MAARHDEGRQAGTVSSYLATWQAVRKAGGRHEREVQLQATLGGAGGGEMRALMLDADAGLRCME